MRATHDAFNHAKYQISICFSLTGTPMEIEYYISPLDVLLGLSSTGSENTFL